jgi:Rrf2 family transcriptional regulator, iron-sulfur cluster assembly transcription factor
MHVSRKADYGVRALAYLAKRSEQRVLIAEIATAMAVPRAFLSKIMKELVGGGLVHSQVGPGGGYRLARHPNEISFKDIIEIVEGPWNLVPCQADEPDRTCRLHEGCTSVDVWDRIQRQMLDILSSYTLDQVESEGFVQVGGDVVSIGAAR